MRTTIVINYILPNEPEVCAQYEAFEMYDDNGRQTTGAELASRLLAKIIAEGGEFKTRKYNH